ncbi:MAG: M50 family metallopeptidase, partial [Clostridiales bacterium]|nr:M50 family metallopeptidase [Clostridiales bacterium]
RIIVLLGGVVSNFLSAIVFSLIYIGVVGFPVPEITEVYKYVDPGTQIETAYNKFEVGDKIIAINGEEISVLQSYNDIMEDVGNKDKITFRVLRGGKEQDIEAERKEIIPTTEGEKPYVGFGFKQTSAYIGNTAGNAFAYCVPYTFKLSWSILGSFGDIITGKQSITSMTGPVGSIKLMADVTVANWRNILILLPLLASNLAIFNLLPIPALDGARIIFTIIEWIRKKPINRKVESMIHFVGMVVLLLFVLVVDILSFAL